MEIKHHRRTARANIRRGRTPARRGADTQKRTSPYRTISRKLLALSVLLVLALAGVFAARFYFTHIPGEKKLRSHLDEGAFLNGIVINGKNVSGMTLDEARNAITPMLEEQAANINISVAYGTSLWLFTAADMQIKTDLEQVLAQAMLCGRGGSPNSNRLAKKELKEAGMEYSVAFVADEYALAERVSAIASAINTPPTDPHVEPDIWSATPAFTYIEGSDGMVLDEKELVASINQALAVKDFDARLQPELKSQSSEHTLEWYRENTQLRSTWTTSFGSSSSSREPNRVGNIQKAVTLLHGHRVDVGEEFNFNAYIGPRHEKDGWPLAPGIVNGNTYEMQAGGGICQVTTTLYNALLCSGPEIDITERHHHSWPSSYADTGLDSTVTGSAESGKSLNFVNNTGAPMYIFAYCDQEEYTVTIYIYGEPLPAGITYDTRGEVIETIEPGETVTVENPNWPLGYEEKTINAREGYKAEAYRDKYENGTLVDSELLYTDNYRAVAGELTVGVGDPSLPKPAKS